MLVTMLPATSGMGTELGNISSQSVISLRHCVPQELTGTTAKACQQLLRVKLFPPFLT